jgi:hypothetical protein
MAMMDDASSDVQKRNLSIEFIGIIAGRVYNAGSTKVEPNGHSEGNDPSESDSLTYGDVSYLMKHAVFTHLLTYFPQA